ncbi:MAG: DUF3108 domain-containing protein [Alphaproteobacteria bacterium]
MRVLRIVVLVVCGYVLPAGAAERRISLSFDIYSAGLHALHIDLGAAIEGSRYMTTADVATQGFTDLMLRWRSRMVSTGRLVDGYARPAEHQRDGEWRFNRRVTRMTYAGDGNVAVVVEPEPEDDDRPPVALADRRNTVDLLSALTPALLDRRAADCDYGASVYDGRRRYDFRLERLGEEDLPATEYGSFQGQAMRCAVRLTPVAGFRTDDEESGLGFPQNLSVWLARDIDKDLTLPVRFQADFDVGALVGHLTKVAAD